MENLEKHYNFFERLIESIKKNGKKNVLFGVIIFFLLLNIISNPLNINRIIEKWENKKELYHLKGIEKRKEADLIIPDKLENILLKSGADRVMVFEFHNGGTNSINLPFYHFTCTYEVARERVNYVYDQYQNQNSGNYTAFFDNLVKHHYVYVDNINELEVNHLHRKMLCNGVMSYMIAGIFEGNKMIGIIAITSDNKNMDIEYLKGVIPHITNQLSHLLSGVGERNGKK